MLNVIDLDFDYQEEPLIKKVNFRLPLGGLLHLKGANGAGKTTLLKLLAGLHDPIEGRIESLGQSIEKNRDAYQKQLCFVGHKTGVNLSLTPKENCLFDRHYTSTHVTIENLASVFGLEDHMDKPCALLSAGQRRQVALLRLWMTKAPLWLLDEPLVALDELTQKHLIRHIQSHREKGGAIVLTSHQPLPVLLEPYQEYLL